MAQVLLVLVRIRVAAAPGQGLVQARDLEQERPLPPRPARIARGRADGEAAAEGEQQRDAGHERPARGPGLAGAREREIGRAPLYALHAGAGGQDLVGPGGRVATEQLADVEAAVQAGGGEIDGVLPVVDAGDRENEASVGRGRSPSDGGPAGGRDAV